VVNYTPQRQGKYGGNILKPALVRFRSLQSTLQCKQSRRLNGLSSFIRKLCSKKELKADVLQEEIYSTAGLLGSGGTNSAKAGKKI